MSDCWLRSNQRVMQIAMLLPALVLLGGVLLALGWLNGETSIILRRIGGIAAIFALLALVILLYVSRLPRLAYDDGHLLVYLQSTQPIRVPIQIVECFFLGQAESDLHGPEVQTNTVVVRLAEADTDWHNVKVKPALGRWRDGYITVFGTWCEPLNVERVDQMNHLLATARREAKQIRETS